MSGESKKEKQLSQHADDAVLQIPLTTQKQKLFISPQPSRLFEIFDYRVWNNPQGDASHNPQVVTQCLERVQVQTL